MRMCTTASVRGASKRRCDSWAIEHNCVTVRRGECTLVGLVNGDVESVNSGATGHDSVPVGG